MRRLSALVALSVLVVGCRLAPGATAPSSAPTSGVDVAVDPTASPAGEEAPADCGFPDDAALEFAGRSTYAELRVGDAQGDSVDPMSDDPADIYITRDTFNQGEQHGRLVCAIFVGANEGFVEITVHPEDWDKFTPVPEPGEPSGGLTGAEAAEAARAYLPEGDEWYVETFSSGPIANVYSDWQDHDWGQGIPADHWVWMANARRGTQGYVLIIDYVDGTVIGAIEYALDDCGRSEGDPEFGEEDCPDR